MLNPYSFFSHGPSPPCPRSSPLSPQALGRQGRQTLLKLGSASPG